MRRLTSALMGAAITLASVAGVAVPASAATPGNSTETTVTTATPTTPTGLRATRIMRLSRTGEFLAVGRTTADGSRWYMWQIKPDNTLDTSFGTSGIVDLGFNDSTPCTTGSNSVSACTSVNSIAYNETANSYALVFTRFAKTSTSTYQFYSVITGDLKTGAIKSTTNVRESTGLGSYNSSSDADFATLGFNTQDLAKAECTAARGASVNGALLSYGATNFYNLFMVPNGDLVVPFNCSYTNLYASAGNLATPSGTVKEYNGNHYAAFKVVNNALTVDSTWGTSGRLIPISDLTKQCEMGSLGMGATVDLGITSMSSTKPFTLVASTTMPRVTTMPGGNVFPGWTGYDGCSTYNQSSSSITYTNKLLAVTANGKSSEAGDLGTPTSPAMPTRWVIDPAGRWVTLLRSVPAVGVVTPGAPSTTYVAVRVANGKLDTTFGTGGLKTLTSLSTTTTVNGVSYSINYSLTGMITTADEVLFTGSTSKVTWSPTNSNICMSTGNGSVATIEYRPFVFSLKSGDIDKTYGTSGLGNAFTYTAANMDYCSGYGSASFVTSKGQPAMLRFIPTQGSQTMGLKYVVWDTVANATGGGDGGTGTGGSTKDTGGTAFTGEKAFSAGVSTGSVEGRVDAKVYTKAPAKVQENSAVTVLSAADADDLDLVSTTPAVCVALTTTVVFTGAGKCSVRIIDEETRKVIRTFTTTVAKAEQTVGTVLTTDEPIYFRIVSSSLSTKAKAQIAALAEKATGIGRILIVGHTASLYDNQISNKRIAQDRANAVKAALAKAGVKAPMTAVSVGSADPVATAKTEAAQAKNRRVEIFFFPAAG